MEHGEDERLAVRLKRHVKAAAWLGSFMKDGKLLRGSRASEVDRLAAEGTGRPKK
jgi:hypothetical protein